MQRRSHKTNNSEQNHYYPFGLKHEVYVSADKKEFDLLIGGGIDGGIGEVALKEVLETEYLYKYNGIELQDELGLNMYAMDMRMYDPAIARWVVLDPVTHFEFSPYNAFDNNPVFWADPSGADAVNIGYDREIDSNSFSGSATWSGGFQEIWDNGKDNSNNANSFTVTNNDNGGPENGEPKNGDPKNGSDPAKKKPNKGEVGNAKGTYNAVIHYYNGNGEPAEVGYEAKLGVISSKKYKRVVKRLKEGIANERSSVFGVNLTMFEFHVGKTNVEYSTSCTKEDCITIFRAFVNDGFRDPLDIGVEPGGIPYDYIPWVFSINYENPGYPIGENIK